MTNDFACDGRHYADDPCNEAALDRLVEKLRPVIREEVRKASLGARFFAARQKADAGRDAAREALDHAAESLAKIQEAQ